MNIKELNSWILIIILVATYIGGVAQMGRELKKHGGNQCLAQHLIPHACNKSKISFRYFKIYAALIRDAKAVDL